MSDDSSDSSSSSSDALEEAPAVESENEVSGLGGEEEEGSKQPIGDGNAADAAILALGDDEDDDDDEIIARKPKKQGPPGIEASALFGDLSDDDEGGSDEKESGGEVAAEDEYEEDVDRDDQEGLEEGVEEQGMIERLIQVDMPYVRYDLGNELYYVRLPNFLSIDPRPFDPQTYQGEGGDEEVLDEEGRTRVKMSVENTIRWQYVRETAEDGSEQIRRISNTRIVRWSDGSMSLHLGDEIFDMHVMSEQQDYNHMYVKQGNGLVGQAVFRKKLTFRPHSTDSLTHRKMTLSMADKTKRVQQVKEMPLLKSLKNPEMNKAQLLKQEEDALKATMRRESQQRRVRDRLSVRSLEHGMGDDDEGDISLSSIKRRVYAKPRSSLADDFINDDYDSSSDSEAHGSKASDAEEDIGPVSSAAARSKKRRLVVDDD